MLLRTQAVGGHLALQLRDAVVSPDFATHIEGLRQQDEPCRHVARVGMERIGEPLSQGVSALFQRRQIAAQALEQRQQVGIGCRQLLHGLSHATGGGSAKVVELLFLFVAQQRHLFARAHIACGKAHLGQVIGARRFVLPPGLFKRKAGLSQLLVVAQGHGAATVERQHRRLRL